MSYDDDDQVKPELEERNQLTLLKRRPNGSIDWSSEANVTEAQIEGLVMNAYYDKDNPYIIFRRSPVAASWNIVIGGLPTLMSIGMMILLFMSRMWLFRSTASHEPVAPKPGQLIIPQVKVIGEGFDVFASVGFFIAFFCIILSAIGILWGINEFWNEFQRFEGMSFFGIKRRLLQPNVPLFTLSLIQGEYTYYNVRTGVWKRTYVVRWSKSRSGVNTNTRKPKRGDFAFPTQEGESDTDVANISNPIIDDRNWVEKRWHFGTVYVPSAQQGASDNAYNVYAPGLVKRILQAGKRLVLAGRIQYGTEEED